MGISVGLVGLGAFGSAFADMFKSHPLVDRVALCDMEAERIAKFAEKESFQDKFDSKDAFERLDEIVKADLDALVIITQPWLHAPQAIQAMESGKHVYSAVPVMSLPDGDEILDWIDRIIKTCEKTGRYYMLGETTYYRPQAMFCRHKAAAGEFGDFVFSEGEYFHDVDHGLREVQKHRTASKSGREWVKKSREYAERGIMTGPMHYPTHSVSGPMCVMNAHAVKACCVGFPGPEEDAYLKGSAFGDETAFFRMSNGSVMRICEYRHIGIPGREMFNIFGTQATFYGAEGWWGKNRWMTKWDVTELDAAEIRDPLPPEVFEAFRECSDKSDAYGGHGGSHAYLVHEFVSAVAEDRQPAVNAWAAARYMAAGVMAHKSALKDGEWLEVPDWGDGPARD